MPEESENVAKLSEQLEAEISRRYGHLLGADALKHILGYPSIDAVRTAMTRRTIPVHVFEIKNRRGKWALATDVAEWLAHVRYGRAKDSEKER